MIIVDMSARTHLALGVGELSAAVFRGYFYVLGALLQDWIDFVYLLTYTGLSLQGELAAPRI